MSAFEQRQLVDKIVALDGAPDDSAAFDEWLPADSHLQFLRNNARANRLVLLAMGSRTYVHSVVAPAAAIDPPDKVDLINWSWRPFSSAASYVTGGGRDDLWVERIDAGSGSESVKDAYPLILGRTFEGWPDHEGTYFEVLQEFAHLADIHWRPEASAYCRFDHHGDLEHVVSVTRRETSDDTAVVSCLWEPLEVYLAATRSVLIRVFDFTLFRPSGFRSWPNRAPDLHLKDDDLYFKRLVDKGHAAYTRGAQIIGPREPSDEIFKRVADSWAGRQEGPYVEFVAHDWRNGRIAKISTDPAATTNYFEAAENSLPYELSPAFFRPEVLAKYKADRDKYTVRAREITCRAAWHLRSIDVNEAGQVHAYICDLRGLPHAEQLHWLSHNEEPRASISDRAVTNDFKGEWVETPDPLTKVLSTVRGWNRTGVQWWTLRDPRLLDQVNTPVTSSRDEWSGSFMDLTKLVVEGFEIRSIRAALDARGEPYESSDRSIVLLEKLLRSAGEMGATDSLVGLRMAQQIRSKVKGHVGGSEAKRLAQAALAEHGTFSAHFLHVTRVVGDELDLVQRVFQQGA